MVQTPAVPALSPLKMAPLPTIGPRQVLLKPLVSKPATAVVAPPSPPSKAMLRAVSQAPRIFTVMPGALTVIGPVAAPRSLSLKNEKVLNVELPRRTPPEKVFAGLAALPIVTTEPLVVP